eukprot:m.1333352 g.1333352  ORF g.1333352 m.1333352 type:complete len:415 (+) comp24870_c0_seq11:120-1364(+)
MNYTLSFPGCVRRCAERATCCGWILLEMSEIQMCMTAGIDKYIRVLTSTFGNPTAAQNLSAFAATLSVDGTLCLNAVTAVHHDIVWKGNTIEQMVSFVTLGSAPADVPVSQHFRATFTTVAYDTTALPDRYEGAETSRGGNPGYIRGRVLTDPTGAVVQQLRGGVVSGACTDATLQAVAFGVDQASGCQLFIRKEDSCAAVVDAATTAMSRGLSTLRTLHSYGTPFSDTVPVLTTSFFEVPENVTSDLWNEIAFPETFCDDIPTQVTLDVMVVQQGLEVNPQSRIIGAKLTTTYSSVQLFDCEVLSLASPCTREERCCIDYQQSNATHHNCSVFTADDFFVLFNATVPHLGATEANFTDYEFSTFHFYSLFVGANYTGTYVCVWDEASLARSFVHCERKLLWHARGWHWCVEKA